MRHLSKMKSYVLLGSFVAGMHVACSGASGQEVTDPVPLTNTHPTVDSGVPDASSESSDASVPDTTSPACVGENETVFCKRYSASCGALIATDNCGEPKSTVSCGTCKALEFCNSGACTNLPCFPQDDKSLCLTTMKDCGIASLVDNCGAIRNANCGPSVCGKGFGCAANKCVACVAKACGPNSCGLVADGCNPAPLDCGVCSVGNTCVASLCVPVPPACVPETNVAFCARTVNNCGTITAPDNCGAQRTVQSCGTLYFNGIAGMSMSGGVSVELAAAPTKYIEAWVNPSSPTASIVQVGSSLGTGRIFSLSLIGGNLAVNGSTISLPGNTTVSVPLNAWTFVYAGISGGTGYLGKIVNNIRTEQIMKTDVGGTALLAGDSVVIGSSFIGQMNQVRIWSKVPNTANYHDCIPSEGGLLRQWCFREGSDSAVTSDSVTGTPTALNGTSWATGKCN